MLGVCHSGERSDEESVVREGLIKTFTTKMLVHWYDCDPANIAFYGNFFSYYEAAEEMLFVSLGHPRPQLFEKLKFGLPRVECWSRFRKPARHGDMIEVTAWIEKRTEKSLLYCFEVRREGEQDLVCEGSYWVVCVKRPEFVSAPLPQELLDVLKDYLPPVSHP
jgi:4-hydroxybenzoyl-CoA thioesterase